MPDHPTNDAPSPTSPEAPAPLSWDQVHARLQQAGAAIAAGEPATRAARTLRRRARELAKPLRRAGGEDESPEIECLAFELGGQTYALEANQVREVVRLAGITPLPGLPPTLRGLANVRSRIVPAFDLRPVLQLRPRAEPAERETMLIASGEGGEFGLVVDALLGMRSIRAAQLRSDVAGLQTRFLRGLTDDGMLLLDLPAVAAALTFQDVPAQP